MNDQKKYLKLGEKLEKLDQGTQLQIKESLHNKNMTI